VETITPDGETGEEKWRGARDRRDGDKDPGGKAMHFAGIAMIIANGGNSRMLQEIVSGEFRGRCSFRPHTA